jgi:hypothetical protein
LVSKEELKIYFSNDGGKTYYNEDTPRIALRVPDADADGTNSSGGSSSKGGKKGGENDHRRKLVENTLKEAQRKLLTFCEILDLGDMCDPYDFTQWCKSGQRCQVSYPDYSFRCYKNQKEGDTCDADQHWRYGTDYERCERSSGWFSKVGTSLKCIDSSGNRGKGTCQYVKLLDGDLPPKDWGKIYNNYDVPLNRHR